MFKKSLLLMLLMAFMAPWAAGQTRSFYYERITTVPSDWTAGHYLLVYEASSTSGYAFNGTVSSNTGRAVEVSISDGKISSFSGTAELTFESASTGYFSIKNNYNNKYWYAKSSYPSYLYEASSLYDDDTEKWSLTIANDGKASITNKKTSKSIGYGSTTYPFYPSASNPVYLYERKELTTPYVTVSPESAILFKNQTKTVSAELHNTTDPLTISWESDATGVATVSAGTGSSITVTGVNDGDANIIASITGSTASCTVKVITDILMQNGSIYIPTSGSFNYYDSGGSTGDYSSYEDYTLTLYPAASNNMVKVVFTEFETEGVSWDYLQIYDGTSTSATLIGTYGGTTSPETITASNSDGALTFRFKSDSGGNKSGWEATVSCEAPSSLALGEATDVTYNSAIVNWTGGISPYTVEYKKHSDSDWTTASATVTTKSFQLNDLDPETAYDVKVTDANTSVSQNEYFTTGVAPLVIANATDVTYNSATVNWTGGKANFTVQYKKHSDSDWTTASSSVSTRSYTITPLADNTTYDVKIVDALETAIVGENYFTTEVQYPAPTGLTASNVLAHTAVLNWTVNGTETSWDICYSTTSGDHSTFVTVNPTASENTVSYTLGNNDNVTLASETKYYVSVRSHCGNGEDEHSAWSNEVNFTTDIACHVPTGLTATSTTTSATLSWESTASSFNLQYKAAADADFTTVSNINGNSYALSVNSATSYTYKVQAICGGIDGESNYSEEYAFTTPICDEEDQCVIYYSLQDKYSDGWNDARLSIVDHSTSIVVADLTLRSTTYDSNPKTGTVNVCPGRTYDFVWYKGSYDGECSFTFTDINEEVIISVAEGGASSYTNGQIIKSEYTATCVSTICQKPENLAVSGDPTFNSVTLTWDAITGVAGYEVYISTETTAPTDEVSGEFTNTNSYTTNTLEDNTQYHAWVRTKCADEFYSHWISTSVDFKTPLDCSAKDLSVSSYSDGFEGGELGCWSVSNIHSDSKVASSVGQNSSYGFQFHWNSNPPQYLISPEFSGADAGMNVDFYYKNSSSSYPETFQVGYSTTNEVSDFTWDDEETTASSTQWEHYVNTFPAGTKYIAIKLNSNDKAYLYLDNFTFSAVPTTCDAPTDLTASINGLKATVSWTSDASGFNVKYKPQSESEYTDAISNTNSIELTGLEPNTSYDFEVQAVCAPGLTSEWVSTTFETGADPCIKVLPYTYGFEDAEDFSCWTMADAATGAISSTSHSGSHGFTFSYNSSTSQYIISPELINAKAVLEVKFYYKNANLVYPETFKVGYSTSNVIADFTWDDNVTASDGNWTLYESTVPANTKYIAVSYITEDKAGLAIDDFSFNSYDYAPTGEWEEGEYEEVIIFNDLTVTGDVTANNLDLSDGVAVVVEENASLTVDNLDFADGGVVTVNEGGILTINNGTNNGSASNIIIKDGGQLFVPAPATRSRNSNDVAATMEKEISAWTTDPVGGWYFIASPINVDNLNPSSITNMLPADVVEDEVTIRHYDLYWLENTMWRNYRQNSFNMANGQGYLYANANNQTLQFAGNVKPYSTEDNQVEVSEGWNLIGNPYTIDVYANQNYYKMNSDGTAVEPVNAFAEPIAPCTGIVVEADAAGSVTFSKPSTDGAINNGNQGNIEMTLSQQVANTRGNSNKTLDNAIVSFNEGSELHKFYFMQQNAVLYIPQGAEEYAIVNAEAAGEMPVNFKANEDGQYTLTVNAENVEMNYLHLIDNITGADIDLLQTPSYTFNASNRDYESRFRLVFVANENDNENENQSFAFCNNGNWIIVNEGRATLQVIDVTGRILSSETVNGSVSKSINAPAGVYMIRLINGNDVKVQKVVVR